MKRIISMGLLLVATLILGLGCGPDPESFRPSPALQQMRVFFEKQMIPKWYPASLDMQHGGFLSNLEYDWQPSENQDKMIVTQARHLWTLSKISQRYPDSLHYRAYADHGYQYLRNSMWDPGTGGFHNLVNRNGQVVEGDPYYREKRTYGNAFGIYALAAYAGMSGSGEALEFAKRAFRILERDAFDPRYGGYFQFLIPAADHRESASRDPGNGARRNGSIADSIRDPYKDQNTTIHIMEAYAELYRIWPNDTLRSKLANLITLVRDTITTERGTMQLFFNHSWEPVSYKDSTERNYDLDHVSFGHDIETAFLILDALDALGEIPEERTLGITEKMLTHSLRHGFDAGMAGMFERGYYEGENLVIIDSGKNWWSQSESLNSLLVFDHIYPDRGYVQEFEKLWDYVNANFLDHENGGWYEMGIDKDPESKTGRKAHIWKGPYHTFRSMLNCIAFLERLERIRVQKLN